ncbi:MAG: acetate--CoA ligase [Desulfovibrio sp.]
MDKGLETLLQEEIVYRPLPQLVIDANVNPHELEEAYRFGKFDPTNYWEEAADDLDWFKKWENILNKDAAPYYKWFEGARCNIVYNALDRHIVTATKNKLALIWEGEPGDFKRLTYYELYREVNRFANALRKLGVKKGDRVAIYMPNLPETMISMLACARIGAVHSVVNFGFSTKELRMRIDSLEARVVITADGFYRNGQIQRLKSVVDDALETLRNDCVESMIVVRRTNVEVEMQDGRDFWYEELVRAERPEAHIEVMEADDPLFVLHTSSPEGGARGVVHGHGGYMVGVHRTFSHVYDIKPTDIYWCTADPGNIRGHSAVVYGPLLAGTTTVMYEGHTNYPQADRLWHIVAKYGVTIFSTSPTMVRMLKRFGAEYPSKQDLSTLRLLGLIGEPINSDSWLWYYRNIGHNECPVLDTWCQSETGMFMVSPLAVSLLKPGSVTKPLPGVDVDVVDAEGKSLEPSEEGYLVIKSPWPSMMTGILNDEEAYRSYWGVIPNVYYAGEHARRDENGFIWIKGRADKVLNIGGNRMSASTIERAFETHRKVQRAQVFSVADKIKGEMAKAVITLHEDVPATDDLMREFKQYIRKELGAIAEIKNIELIEQ